MLKLELSIQSNPILSGVDGIDAKEIQAGAGRNWNVLDEIAILNVVTQSTPIACGAACGEMLLCDICHLSARDESGQFQFATL